MDAGRYDGGAWEHLAGLPVLIVEDQPQVAMVAQDMIEALGGRVFRIAATIGEGLTACREGGFAVALLDIDLGGHASMPVAEALAAAGTPFLFTTGLDAVPPHFPEAPLLAKPYTLRALRGVLTALVSAPAAARAPVRARPASIASAAAAWTVASAAGRSAP